MTPGISIVQSTQDILLQEDISKPLRSYIDQKKYYLISKRVFDIFVSLPVILFIMSWLIPVMAVLIKLDSRGPVFFRQKRVGKGCRSFTCLKFRTMVVNSFADEAQSFENDPRITRIGKFLRKSNIDELPQFFNVFAGAMSIIGPRPHMFTDCNRFGAIIPGYRFRSFVAPGITGLAQVKGYYGPAYDFETIFRRYQWDAFYVRNFGFWLDLRIFQKTLSQRTFYIIKYFSALF